MIQLPDKSVRAPLWVLDPKTNKEVDVAAFLETLDEFDTIYDDSLPIVGAGGVAAIQSIIRLLNLTEMNRDLEPLGSRVDTYADLHRLVDMFQATHIREANK